MRNRNIAFFAAGGFVAALFLAGAAHAITDTVFKYSTPQVGHFTVDALGFSPDSNGVQYGTDWTSGGKTTSAQSFGCFNTAVDLPNGARLKGLDIWYKTQVRVQFLRHKLSDGTLHLIGSDITFTDGSGTRQLGKMAFASELVDSANYSYGIGVCLTSGSFYAARVDYTYTTAGN
ncbi:MAG TPA: hypothetical protein VL198_12825 [Pseudolabrys sp.]|nr:hypothetical protein [Pseudolabrys sp.]